MPRRYPQQEFTASGKLIKRLTSGLAKVKDWSMEQSMAYIGDQTHKSSDMVYRWQQGRSLPKPEIIEVLARIAYREAELSREWCEELLDVTHHPDGVNLLNKLWGPKELQTIPNRLAPMEHRRLIGREEEMKQLQDLLLPRYAAHLITVDGIGGVGKTALALDVAYQSLWASTGEIVRPQVPTFEAIIFVSAKQQYLTPHGPLQRTQVHHTLRKIFQEVTNTFERHGLRTMPQQEQASLVYEILGRQRTLLIVDNLETMEDKQEILSFLFQLPPTVKVVVTTRERAMFAPVRLEQLAEEAAQELIEQQAEEKQVKLETGEAQRLYQRIGGIPAALVYAIGQRAAGYTLETVLNKVPKADGDVARFCFHRSVEPLRGTPAHAMLMAFALFPQMPSRSAVSYVAGLENDPIAAEEALAQLQRLSLIRDFQDRFFQDRFRMLPLTREYALAELKANLEFEREARERWIDWCLRFVQRYGGHDMEEWHVRYDHLDEDWENLLALFDWCTRYERYDVMKAFWCAEEPGSVLDFTKLYDHWDDRLVWVSWLIDAAEGRRDWRTVLDGTASKAMILSLMDRYQEAQDCFNEGQKYQAYAEPYVKVRLFVNNAYPYIYQNRFDEVIHFLNQARDLVEQVSAPLCTRFILNIDYNYAAVFYWRGEVAAAWEAFNSVMERANAFGWQWLANAAQNYLGDIAIKEGDYDEAERLLETGLRIAERNNEKRRAARYKRSLANLRQQQGRRDEGLALAQQAHDDFHRLNRLGIDLEIERTKDLIRVLSADMPDNQEKDIIKEID